MTDVKPAKDTPTVTADEVADKPLPIEAEAQEAANGHQHPKPDLAMTIHRSTNDPGIFVVQLGGVDISALVERDSLVVHTGTEVGYPKVALTLVPTVLEVWL